MSQRVILVLQFFFNFYKYFIPPQWYNTLLIIPMSRVQIHHQSQANRKCLVHLSNNFLFFEFLLNKYHHYVITSAITKLSQKN